MRVVVVTVHTGMGATVLVPEERRVERRIDRGLEVLHCAQRQQPVSAHARGTSKAMAWYGSVRTSHTCLHSISPPQMWLARSTFEMHETCAWHTELRC